MSTDVALQAMFDRFMGRFVLPLVDGGDLLVSFPIGPGALEYFLLAPHTDVEVNSSIIRARQRNLNTILPWSSPNQFEEEEIHLLSSLHNVLLSENDEIVNGFRGESRQRWCRLWAAEFLESVGECTSAETALKRHSLLFNLPNLKRKDTILKTRGSLKRYAGSEPPKRALIWPKLRKLETSEQKVGLPIIFQAPEAKTLYSGILDRTPLTCLLEMPYGDKESIYEGEFRWNIPMISSLSNPEICRTVTYRHLDLGFEKIGPILTHATLRSLKKATKEKNTPETQILRFALQYMTNLHLTHLWTSDEKNFLKPLRNGWSSGKETQTLRKLFFGWIVAALSREDRIGAPTMSKEDGGSLERSYIKEAKKLAGSTNVEKAAQQIDWIFHKNGSLSIEGGQNS